MPQGFPFSTVSFTLLPASVVVACGPPFTVFRSPFASLPAFFDAWLTSRAT